MNKEKIYGLNGYHISCINNLSHGNKTVVIISHGFGSSKESHSTKAVSDTLSKYGIGTFGFDFPAHGDSPVDGEYLRIDNCLNDLASVEAHVHMLMPKAEIAYFSSSFGAYINLIFLATRPNLGKKSFLRCAAVDMPGIFKKATTPAQYRQLKTQGYVLTDNSYVRPLKITMKFCEDLGKFDVFKLCRRGMADIAMVHGDADEIASILDARRFAEKFGVKLIEARGADHRFLSPGGMDLVINSAVQFYINK